MNNLNLSTLILCILIQCISKVNAQDSIIINKNDTIPFTNKYVSSSEKYSFGLSSQLCRTYKLNTTSGLLIVIDGIPYPDRTTDELDFTTADLNDIAQLALIPLESIESVELLDYDASTLLYGSDARNGVLAIITKKHSSNKLHVNYSYRNTFSKQPQGYTTLSGDDYTMMMKQALFNSQLDENAANIRAFLYDKSWSEYENFNNNTDWQDEITQPAFNQEHYLALSGQTNKLGYQLATEYNKGKGTMIYTSNEDYSIHLKLNYQPIKILTAKFHVNYNNLKADSYNTFSDLDLYEGALKKMSNMSVYDSEVDGTLTSEYYVPTIDALVHDGNYTNPVHYANISSQNNNKKIFNPTFSLELTPIKRLKYTLTASVINKQYSLELYDPTLNYTYSSNYRDIGTYATSVYKINTLYLTNVINYFLIQNNSNQLKLSATYSINTREYETDFESFGTYIAFLNADTELKKQNITGAVKYAALSRYYINLGVGRENYKLTNHNIEFTDYSSNGYSLDIWDIPNVTFLGPPDFISNGYSLNVNAKWIISNESFFKHLDYIVHLSIAASISNHNIPLSDAYDEKQQDVCFNTHLQLLNRFSFNVNYYQREIKDQFIDSHNSFRQSILNKGWEFNTNIAVIDKSNFKFNIFANLYKNTEQIIETNYDLNYDFDYTNGTYFKKGEYGKIYGFKYNGVYQFIDYIEGIQENAPVARDAEGNVILDFEGNPSPMTIAKGTSAQYQFRGGDAIYEDINHDGNIDENDIKLIGNVQSKLTGTGGTSLQYKNWWFGVFFNFRYGNDIVNIARMDLENMYTYNNQTTAVNNRWRKDGDQANIPRALYGYGYNWLGSTRFVEDGSFFRLKAITLKYQVSEEIISKLHLSSLSFYITGKNLITKTNYQGADPDISLNTTWDNFGFDNNFEAAIKQWIFGINISL